MKPRNYYRIKVIVLRKDELLIGKIKSDAVSIFDCDFIEEFTMDSEEVERVLGRESLVSDILPESIINKIENEKLKSDRDEFAIIFSRMDGKQRSADCFSYLNKNYPSVSFERVEKKWEDGIEAWKKYFSSIHVTKDINIFPLWQQNDSNRYDKDKIFINPGQGFGTGGHETTWLCLKFFNDLVQNEKQMSGECLDLGCGSGILGIAAIKHSNMYVTFCDVDTEAMDNCLENLTLNFKEQELEGHSLIIRERLNPDKTYDLIFANILQQVLLSEKKFILNSLKHGGYLIMSGLLVDQMEEMKNSYNNLDLIHEEKKNGWGAIMFRKK